MSKREEIERIRTMAAIEVASKLSSILIEHMHESHLFFYDGSGALRVRNSDASARRIRYAMRSMFG